MIEYDAVIVGARCAGSALAGELARRGCDVLLVDRDGFPSTTVSTHNIWPSGVARLEELGVIDRIRSEHELPGFGSRVYGLGHETVGGFTHRSRASTAPWRRGGSCSTRRRWTPPGTRARPPASGRA